MDESLFNLILTKLVGLGCMSPTSIKDVEGYEIEWVDYVTSKVTELLNDLETDYYNTTKRQLDEAYNEGYNACLREYEIKTQQ